MIKNVGLNDKKLRILFALIIALVAIIFQIWWLFIVTIVLFATASMQYCPLYHVAGKSTNNESETKTEPLNVPAPAPANNPPQTTAAITAEKKPKAKTKAKTKKTVKAKTKAKPAKAAKA